MPGRRIRNGLLLSFLLAAVAPRTMAWSLLLKFHPHGRAAPSCSSSSRLWLHPRQAKDLEACALELTLECIEQRQQHQVQAPLDDTSPGTGTTPSDPHVTPRLAAAHPVALGPGAWCRRLWTRSMAALRP